MILAILLKKLAEKSKDVRITYINLLNGDDKLKALLKTKKGKGFLEIKDMPIPEINENEVLIKVYYSGICGTDIHILLGEFTCYPPVILGHEFSGEIVKVGKRVASWKSGDRVVAECQSLVCGKCRYCRTGHPEACSSKDLQDGGLMVVLPNILRCQVGYYTRYQIMYLTKKQH